MSFLDGGGAALMSSVFSSIYLDATLYRPATGGDDGKGGGDDPSFDAGAAVKVQMEAATQAMRETEGYEATDVRFLMLAQGVERPTSDCELELDGIRYGIRTPGFRDPCGSYWDIHGRVIGEATAS